MSDPVTPAAAPATPASVADRLKQCIKIVNNLVPADVAKADVKFLFNELLDLMAEAQQTQPNLPPHPPIMPAPIPASESLPTDPVPTVGKVI